MPKLNCKDYLSKNNSRTMRMAQIIRFLKANTVRAFSEYQGNNLGQFAMLCRFLV